MFEKLLANLPYNPNLTKQVAFYARRLRQEDSIRRTGMVFMVLAFMVQFFAFVSPPQSTTAYSSSDMINGGINSKDDALRACRDNTKNFGDALWNFGISCNDIAGSGVTSVRSTDYDGRLFSMSWLPYGNKNPHSGKPTDETPLNMAKVSETLYGRRLTSADTGPYSIYQVLKGTNDKGRTFFIMFGCGNLMLIGVPVPVETCQYRGEIYYKGDRRCNPPESVGIVIDTPCRWDPKLSANDRRCVRCPYNHNIDKNDPRCKPCDAASGSANGQACIVQSKVAANTTQQLQDANGTTAQPNDVIVYTLFAENQGKKDIERFIMQENLSDVLDYAEVVSLHGGKLSKTNLVSWPESKLKAGSKLNHKITVRIKNPLPTNSPSAADPNHFDHVLTNVYGNTVNIRVPLPPGVAPAALATGDTLPETGPAESLIIAALLIAVAGYFLARNRLLISESMVVVQEKNGGNI